MKLSSARYLLRFDDLCPAMAKAPFERFMQVAERHRVRPILAVVPDNRDPELDVEGHDPDFWHRMRALESSGATIALHGFRHLCQSRGPSLLGLHSQTEFAGVSEATQSDWIRSGLALLREKSLSPKLFIAPRHGFDAATLRALVHHHMPVLSDGFAERPFTRAGVLWIPQQLWEPVQKPRGLWTICLHTNTAPTELEDKLDLFLHRFADRFTSFDEVTATLDPPALSSVERIREAFTLQRLRLKSA